MKFTWVGETLRSRLNSTRKVSPFHPTGLLDSLWEVLGGDPSGLRPGGLGP